MTCSSSTRQAIQNWARKFIAAYQLPAQRATTLTRHVVRVTQANLASGRFTRFTAACGQAMPAALATYIKRVAATVVLESARLQLLERGDAAEWRRVQGMLTQRAYHLLCALRDPSTAQAQAPDFANDTCAIIFTTPFPFDVAFDAWATTILKNRILAQCTRSPDVLDHEPFRVSLQAPSDADGQLLDETVPHAHAEKPFEQIEDRVWVCAALAQLGSAAQRNLVQAIYLDGKTFAEYAAQNGVSLQATYNLHHRALAQLKKIFLSTTPQEKREKKH